MHELAVTESIVAMIVERLGDARITRVELEIGALCGVVPDSVRFCFELVTAGTGLEGAELSIVESPGRARCRDCRTEANTRDPIPVCACGSLDVEVTGGQELSIRSVEVGEYV